MELAEVSAKERYLSGRGYPPYPPSSLTIASASSSAFASSSVSGAGESGAGMGTGKGPKPLPGPTSTDENAVHNNAAESRRALAGLDRKLGAAYTLLRELRDAIARGSGGPNPAAAALAPAPNTAASVAPAASASGEDEGEAELSADVSSASADVSISIPASYRRPGTRVSLAAIAAASSATAAMGEQQRAELLSRDAFLREKEAR